MFSVARSTDAMEPCVSAAHCFVAPLACFSPEVSSPVIARMLMEIVLSPVAGTTFSFPMRRGHP